MKHVTDHENSNKNRGPSFVEKPATSTLATKPVVAKRGGVGRFIKTLVVVFAIVLAGIFAVAYFSGGERESLPFAYEGFD